MTGPTQQPADSWALRSPGPLGEHARRAARTYGAAADHYDLAPLGCWDRFGARAVGPAGRVLGIDVAAPPLELARAKAARQGLAHTVIVVQSTRKKDGGTAPRRNGGSGHLDHRRRAAPAQVCAGRGVA